MIHIFTRFFFIVSRNCPVPHQRNAKTAVITWKLCSDLPGRWKTKNMLLPLYRRTVCDANGSLPVLPSKFHYKIDRWLSMCDGWWIQDVRYTYSQPDVSRTSNSCMQEWLRCRRCGKSNSWSWNYRTLARYLDEWLPILRWCTTCNAVSHNRRDDL